MKKTIILLTLVFALLLAGCGKNDIATDETPKNQEADVQTEVNEEKQSFDVDLTALSSTMVYSEVYNMMNAPDGYIGKTVRMNGSFSVYTDEATGKNYYACLIADATACCSQGIEFALKDERAYPDDFPAIGTEITVSGTFHTYSEGEYTYCELADAVLE